MTLVNILNLYTTVNQNIPDEIYDMKEKNICVITCEDVRIAQYFCIDHKIEDQTVIFYIYGKPIRSSKYYSTFPQVKFSKVYQ